jgi:hypothetical protein
MSVEEDIGGLKSGMTTVTSQTSEIFRKMDDLTKHVIEHTTETRGRLSSLEDRDIDFKDQVGGISDRVDKLEDNHTKAKWWLFGVGGSGAVGGATVIEIIKSTLRGG